MLPVSIHARIEHDLATLPPGALVVGYSGGADSSVLLHALAQFPAARARGLRAVHVDHGLHADSAAWSEHCHAFAAALAVPMTCVRVDVEIDRGGGLEEAARSARMNALATLLHAGDILVFAHHRDDQAETVLLKLLRGAGPQGLAGMATLRGFAQGHLWRPLLTLPRACLRAYAGEHAVRWIEDPSNADLRLRRNFLRADILPRLHARWPDAEIALAHSATWARHAADFIDGEAHKALARCLGSDPMTLRWRDWLDLPEALRDPVLRRWLRAGRWDEPAHFHVAQLERQLREAPADRQPCVSFGGTRLRRYRELLHALRALPALPQDWQTNWDGTSPLALPDGSSLVLESVPPPGSPMQVRYRRGGERIKPAGSAHTRDVRLLLQSTGVAPWMRMRIPLVFHDGELLAIGDRVMSEAAAGLGLRLRIEPA